MIKVYKKKYRIVAIIFSSKVHDQFIQDIFAPVEDSRQGMRNGFSIMYIYLSISMCMCVCVSVVVCVYQTLGEYASGIGLAGLQIALLPAQCTHSGSARHICHVYHYLSILFSSSRITHFIQVIQVIDQQSKKNNKILKLFFFFFSFLLFYLFSKISYHAIRAIHTHARI